MTVKRFPAHCDRGVAPISITSVKGPADCTANHTVARFWFEWDPAKSLANERKHGVSFEEATSVLVDPLAQTFADPDHSENEEREITKGYSILGHLLVVAHMQRNGRVRIITARRATARERRKHEEEDSG